MRACFRQQLTRNPKRYKDNHVSTWSNSGGITVPLTVGQRKWMQIKIRDALHKVMNLSIERDKPHTLVMSAQAYSAYKSALMYQSLERI